MQLQTVSVCGLFIACQCAVFGLNVTINRQSTGAAREKSKTIAYIQDRTDTALFAFVVSLADTASFGTGIDVLYYKLKEKAMKMGANAFRLTGYRPGDSTRSAMLALDCFYGEDTVLRQNAVNREKNVLYVFASSCKSDKTSSFKIDKVKKELAGGTYLRRIIDSGQEVKLSKGGMMGATMWCKWKEDRPATYLTVTGFGLADTPFTPGEVNVGFSAGRIGYVDDDLGCLLVLLLEKTE